MDAKQVTTAQRVCAIAAGVLALVLAGLSFTGMFTAVKTEMVPFFHGLAWIVPIGVDTGMLALICAGILLEWLGMPMPALRWVALAFMGASVWLNVSAANGSAEGSVGHAALPVLFITCIEAARHWVRRSTGMANGTLRDGIPLARWILAPWPAFLMYRRMVLQRINSYPDAVTLDLARRNAVTQLRAHFGKDWKRTAPGDLVRMLRKGYSVSDAVIRVAAITGSPVPGAAPPAADTGDRKRRPRTPVPPSVPDPGSTAGSGDDTPPVPPTGPPSPRRNIGQLAAEGKAAEARMGQKLSVKALRAALACNYQDARAAARLMHPEDYADADEESEAASD